MGKAKSISTASWLQGANFYAIPYKLGTTTCWHSYPSTCVSHIHLEAFYEALCKLPSPPLPTHTDTQTHTENRTTKI